jgi:hypothetical protein
MLKYLAYFLFGAAPNFTPALRPVTVRCRSMSVSRGVQQTGNHTDQPQMPNAIRASRMFDIR